MSDFIDIGSMRAKLDPETGVIRITSGEKKSLLQKSGFVLNVKPGSKDHALLTNIMVNREETTDDNNVTEYKLPKVVHLSDKYRSEDSAVVPLGITNDREVISWNTRLSGHLKVTGISGSGKSELLKSIVDHVNTHQKHTKAFYWNSDENDFIKPSDGFLHLYENIEFNDSSKNAGFISRVQQMMMERYEYLEKMNKSNLEQEIDNGDFKRVFVIIDGYENFLPKVQKRTDADTMRIGDHFSATVSQREHLMTIGSILRLGRAAGTHLAISATKFDSEELTNEMNANISTIVKLRDQDNQSSHFGLPGDAFVKTYHQEKDESFLKESMAKLFIRE